MLPLTATKAWISLMQDTLEDGVLVAPRGKLTKELEQKTICVESRRPVVMSQERRLNYKFMAAEAYWILSGSNLVSDIAPYNKNISQFSDDGDTFFGAYGPKVTGQINYVVNKLVMDKESRQAGLTIWRENPPETKDYPCTIAMFFNLRHWFLNCHVYMRSSDQWLGIPYDIFNFSCINYLICARLNSQSNDDVEVKPGKLYITAASSHLYEPNWKDAKSIVSAVWPEQHLFVPRRWYTNEDALMGELETLRHTDSTINSLRWWEE